MDAFFIFHSGPSSGQRAAWLKRRHICNSNFKKSPLVGCHIPSQTECFEVQINNLK